jgi:hypothetical protein
MTKDRAAQQVVDILAGEPGGADDLEAISKRIQSLSAADPEDQRRRSRAKKTPPPAPTNGASSMAQARLRDASVPLHSPGRRIAPHELVRSALFGCGQSRKRRAFHEEPIASLANLTLRYTGEELRQSDLSIYMALLHLAKGQKLSDWIVFRPAQLLALLNQARTAHYYRELRAALTRMQACSLAMTLTKGDGRVVTYSGQIVAEILTERDALDQESIETDGWAVKLNQRAIALLQPGHYSLIDWEVRSQLSPLAQWLHVYYSTHTASAYPHKVDTLRILSGATSSFKSFRQTLGAAIAQLAAAGEVALELGPDNIVRRRQKISLPTAK